MRTSLDFPEPLFRHLKSRAALEGRTLRDLVIDLIEIGLAPLPPEPREMSVLALPSVSLGGVMALNLAQLNNADLAELAASTD